MAETISWYDVAGNPYLLDGSTLYSNVKLAATIGRGGFHGGPMQLMTLDTPQEAGAQDQYVQVLPNLLDVPLYVRAPGGESDLYTGLNALWVAMNPIRGSGKLRNVSPAGVTREVTCKLIDGFTIIEDDQHRGPGWVLLPLLFQASDPFWYETADTTQSIGTGASFSFANAGAIECFPVWTLTGPSSGSITALTLTNTTTGEALTLNLAVTPLTSGHSLVIDTRSNPYPSLLLDGTTNLFGDLSDSSILWMLQPGTNNMTVSYTGGGTGYSLACAYRQRYARV